MDDSGRKSSFWNSVVEPKSALFVSGSAFVVKCFKCFLW